MCCTQLVKLIPAKMEDRNERMNARLPPRLTKFNWTSEFRDSFKECAITCGEAGETIITRQNLVLAPPKRMEMLVPQPVAGSMQCR